MEASALDGPAKSSEQVGFIGLGAMGKPMARRLAHLGYKLLVHDTNPDAVASVVECGARAVPSAKAIADEADIVFTCVPSLDALREVTSGGNGLHAGTAIKTYVDHSTTGVNFAEEVACVLGKRGIRMLASPITGNGRLGIMRSGPRVAFSHARPILEDLASACDIYLGDETGRAQRPKSLNNLLSATGMAVSCEAFVLGVKGGLDPRIMLDIINAGEAGSSATRNKFAHSVLLGRFGFGAQMAITVKDISTTVKDLKVPMWVAQSVREIWKYASSQGGGDKDGTTLITFLEPWTSVEVRSLPDAPRRQSAPPSSDRSSRGYVLVCDAASIPALRDRLRRHGWTVEVSVALVPGSEPGRDSGRHCVMVGLTEGDDVDRMVARFCFGASGTRIVLNGFPMSSTEAARLAQKIKVGGYHYFDVLLAGPARETEAGGCMVIAGGAGSTFMQAKPLLDAIECPVFHGPEAPGTAHLMHQINGSLFATLLAVTCEAFVVGAKAGLEPATMITVIRVETGRNVASEHIVPQQIATRKFNYGQLIGDTYQLLSLLSEEAHMLGVTSWILEKTRLLYGLSIRLGSAQDDVTRFITHYEKWAKTGVRSTAADATA